MDASIISVGSELTVGRQVDTNSAWLSTELTRMGIRVQNHLTVGDDRERIRLAISYALEQAEVVIVTGGLGPTPDDLTRYGLAEAIDQPLEENADALGRIRVMFTRLQRKMSESNRVQALIPQGCDIIPNEWGTAPGIAYQKGERRLFALPGVPSEMEAMFRVAVAPILESVTGGSAMHETRLLCFGIGESRVGELLSDLMARDRDPLVGTTASEGVIGIRILAGRPEAMERDAEGIRRRLGVAVFGEGDDTLELVVGRLLVQAKQTVSTAESCTGGLLAKRLTDQSGSSAYFLHGLVTYANDAKTKLLNVPERLIRERGAVSEEVAGIMASECRTMAGSDYGLSVTGIAGPTGGSPPEKPVGLVYLGMAHAGGVEVKRSLLGEHLTRSQIRDRSCKQALNWLRLFLLGTVG